MTLDEAAQNIGYPVIYNAHEPERGMIKWVRGEYVFVLYDGEANPKATRPEDLEFDFVR